MPLRRRLLLILAGVLVTYAAVHYLVQHRVLLASYLELEETQAMRDGARIQAAVTRELEHLDLLLKDWSLWDDTYQFVDDANQAFIDSNLVLSTFTDNELNVILFFASDRHLVWGQCRDREGGLLALDVCRPPYRDILDHLNAGEVRAILLTDHGPLLTAANPILDSNGKGPARGFMVMGRLLDHQRITALAAQTNLDLRLVAPDDLPPVFPSPSPTTVTLAAASEDTLLAAVPLVPVNRTTPLYLLARLPREILAQGREAMRFSFVSILLAGLALLAALAMLLHRAIVGPLTTMAHHCRRVGESGHPTPMPTPRRDDELGQLARAFNQMLTALDDTRHRLMAQSYNAGLAEMAAGAIHNLGNALAPLLAGLGEVHRLDRTLPRHRLRQACTELTAAEELAGRHRDLARYLCGHLERVDDLFLRLDRRRHDLERQVAAIREILASYRDFQAGSGGQEPCSLATTVEDAWQLVPEPLRRATHFVLAPPVRDLPAVRAVRPLLVQILANLLQNGAEAAAGTTQPRLEVLPGEDAEAGTVHLVVADNGVGLSQEDCHAVFARHVSNKPDKTHSGLGLHWCANATAGMGGRLWAESAGPGRGARFHLVLPEADHG